MNKLLSIIIIIGFVLSQDTLRVNQTSVQGNIRLSDSEIYGISNIYPGMRIVSNEIKEGIDRLWNLNRFNDVQVILESEDAFGINIIIKVEEAPLLNEIIINGNKKIKDKKIIEISELELGQILTSKDIFDAKKKITDKYKDKRFYNIEIQDSVIESELNYTKNLIFNIKEGKKVKINKIIINGSDSIKSKKLKRIMKNNKEGKWYTPWTGKFKSSEIESDKLLLKTFYNNKGYKDYYCLDHELQLNGNSLNIIYNIYEGPEYHYRDIKWVGNEIFNDSTLTKALNISAGDLYHHDRFQYSLFQNVSSLYMDKGYLNLNLQHNFNHIGKDSIDIIFNIEENNIVKVRKVVIKGNDKTNENVIRREINIYPGDIFNRSKFIDVRTKIMLLNFFENVMPDINSINSEEVDLIIDVSEKGVGQANFSMGWNKIQGFNGGGGFQLPNFLGKGQTISLNYNRGLSNNSGFNDSGNQAVGVAQSFSISFFEPAVYDTPNMIGLSFSYYENPGSRTISGLDINSGSMSISFGRRKLKWPDDRFKITWVFTKSFKRYSSYTESSIYGSFPYVSSIDINYLNDKYTFESEGVSLSQILKRRSLNHPEFPTKGSDFTWDLTYSGGKLGGIEDYIKNTFKFNWFIPISEIMTIGSIFKFGDITKTSDYSIIPPQKYFVMGGSGIPYGETLRGYPENSVGPYYYENNYPVGGKLLTRYSLEYRVLFSKSPTMYAFMFADAGNVWSGFNTIDPFKLKRSAGFGIRVFMPMLGLIGYDIGYGFDPSSYGDSNAPWGWDHHLIFGANTN